MNGGARSSSRASPAQRAGTPDDGAAAFERGRAGIRRSRVLPWVAFAALAGCGSADRSASTAFRDSAGIRIAQSDPGGGPLPEWAVAESPALEIGVVDGDSVYQFYNIMGVARLRNGDIVVANSSSGELRQYSPDGMHRRSVGGTGAGPGEYRYLRTLLHLAGDSLLTADALTYRLTVYDADLDAVRSWQAPELGPFTAPPPVARLAVGRWLALTSRTIGEIPGAVEFRMMLVTYDDDGAAVDTIAELPGPRSLIEPCGPDLERMCNRGSRFPAVVRVAVAGDSIFAGNGEGFEIRVLDSSGGLIGIWRIAEPPRPATDAELERDRASLLASAPDDEVRRRLDREYAQTPVPAVMPAYSNILADDDGNIWVEAYHTSYDTDRRFLVLARDGRLLARCTLPGGLDVRQIGADYILGIWKDGNGVEFVRKYGLDRSGDAAGG